MRINFRGFRFDKSKVMSILKIGLPTAIGGSTMQFGFLLMTKNVNVYGATAMTSYGIGNKINSIITMPANGIGSAISTIVGQNMGAGNVKRTDKSYHIALRIGAIFLFVCGMILSRRFIAEPMVRFFTTDDQVVPLATDFLSIMAMCCWTNAFYNVTQGLFQGLWAYYDNYGSRCNTYLDIQIPYLMGMLPCAWNGGRERVVCGCSK